MKSKILFSDAQKNIDLLGKYLEINSMKPKQKQIKAWAVIGESRLTNGNSKVYLPQVGNGNQWQHPIFPSRGEARAYSKEIHGIENQIIVPCTITYTTPLAANKQKKKK